MMRHLPTIVALVALALSPVPRAHAQTTPTHTDLEPVVLAAEPVALGNLGLTLYIPEGASVQTEEIPGGVVKMIVQPEDGTWVLQVYNSKSKNKQLTPAQALDAIIRQVVEAGPVSIDVRDGERYVRREAVDRMDDLRILTAEGEPGPRAARAYIVDRRDIITESGFPPTGYTVMELAPGEFVTLQLDCLPEHFERARQVYETVIATAVAADPDKQARERSLELTTGQAFLESITRDDLDQMMEDKDAPPRWFRIYEPATSGSPSDAKEIGYQRLEVRLGQLGELDTTKPKHEWTRDERTYGYLVILEARTLGTPTASAPKGEVIDHTDVGARFFLSRDRDDEYWTIALDLRAEGNRYRVTQTLIREGDRITVYTLRGNEPREAAEYKVAPEHYLSAVERVLLPRLVADRAKDDAGAAFNLGFYTYDSTRSSVAYRSEHFERRPGGGWQQTTVPFKGSVPWTSTLDREGRLINQALPPNRTIERIELRELHELWKSKGLPTG